jgi:hypothetical protein
MAHQDHFRTHGRVLVRIDALLRQQEDLVLAVTIRDLGFGGAGFEIADPTLRTSTQAISPPIDLVNGVPIVLEVVAPVLWDPLFLPGTIVWSAKDVSNGRPTRAGVRFDPLGATTLMSLFEVLSSN